MVIDKPNAPGIYHCPPALYVGWTDGMHRYIPVALGGPIKKYGSL